MLAMLKFGVRHFHKTKNTITMVVIIWDNSHAPKPTATYGQQRP
jgi:hypothetical protein